MLGEQKNLTSVLPEVACPPLYTKLGGYLVVSARGVLSP